MTAVANSAPKFLNNVEKGSDGIDDGCKSIAKLVVAVGLGFGALVVVCLITRQ